MNTKKKWSMGAALVGSVLVSSLFASSVFAGNVTETKADCVDASVVLLGGDAGAADRINRFIESKRSVTDVADVSATSWELVFPVNGVTTAHGIKCKNGGKCNALAHEFANANPDSAPLAFCGSTVMFK